MRNGFGKKIGAFKSKIYFKTLQQKSCLMSAQSLLKITSSMQSLPEVKTINFFFQIG